MRAVQVYLFCKDVCRLTDRPNYIVGIRILFTADILDLVIGLIEGRADEVCEAGIDNGELLDRAFFYI